MALSLIIAGAVGAGAGGGIAFAGSRGAARRAKRQRRKMKLFENQLLSQFGNDPLMALIQKQALSGQDVFDPEAIKKAGGEAIGGLAERREGEATQQTAAIGLGGTGGAQIAQSRRMIDQARRAQIQSLGDMVDTSFIQQQPGQDLADLNSQLGNTATMEQSIVGAVS